MRLVDDKTHHIAGKEQFFKGFGTQHLRCDIEYGGTAVGNPFESVRPRDGIQKPVDGDRLSDSLLREVVHLVLHQRLERRDDHGEAVFVPSRHDGWKLEGQRLAAAGREDGEQRFTVHRCLYRFFLHRLAVEGAEFVISENGL